MHAISEISDGIDMGWASFIHYRYSGSGEQMFLASTVGVAAADLPGLDTMVLGEAVCGMVAQTQTSMAYSEVDCSEEERLALAAALGARSYASFPLLDGSELLGTLSFGSRTRSSLSTEELDLLQLTTALASRDQIAQAKGMLMLRMGISGEAAWQLLVRLPQTTNLRDVAANLAQHLLQGEPLQEDLLANVPVGLRDLNAPGTRRVPAGPGA